MKKKVLFYISLVSIVVILVVLVGLEKNKVLNATKKLEQQKSELVIYEQLNTVAYKNLDDYISNNDSYIYVGRPTCGDCALFEPAFLNFLEDENLLSSVVYFNVSKIYEDKREWSKFKNKYNIQYTPTIVKIQGGKINSKVEWTPEKGISINRVNDWFKKITKAP